MNSVLFTLHFGTLEIIVTGWKIVGYLGVGLFAGRWIVQIIATKMAGRPVMPRAFWYMSVSGSLLLLTYFTIGKNDSVGVLSNLFPTFTACYNLWMDIRSRRQLAQTASFSEKQS